MGSASEAGPQDADRQPLAILGAADAAILIEDRTRHILRASDSFCELLAVPVPPEALVGMGCDEAARAAAPLFADPDGFLARLEEILEARVGVSGERLELADGRWVERDYVPIEIDGRYEGHVWHYRDITQREHDAKTLREAKAEAERADRAKGEFLAQLSHEIRTPLNAILGMSDLLLGTTLTPEGLACAHSIQRNADALLTLVNDILDLGKIEAGEKALRLEQVDLAELADGVVLAFALPAAAKGVELFASFDPWPPPLIAADRSVLRRVLNNLVSNAVKYTDAGQIVLTIAVRLDEVCFAVEDTGVGIRDDDLERIFEPYQQSANARIGTGLGLSICRTLAGMLGGRIDVSSEFGRGSTFSLIVPLDPGSAQPVPAPPPLDTTVILVSPGRSVLRSYSAQLQRVGAPVLWVGDQPSLPLPEGVVVVDDRVDEALVQALVDTGRPLVLSRAPGGAIHHLDSLGQSVRVLFRPVTTESWRRLITDRGITPQPAPARRSSHRLSVLVVDDNAENRIVASAHLEAGGHRVGLAANGAEGLRMAAEGSWDVVLLDFYMPEMDGFEMLRRLREDEAQQGRVALPVVGFTAHANEGSRQAAAEAGMAGFLEKPTTRDHLLAEVQEAARATRRVLVVDDASDVRNLYRLYLEQEGHLVIEAASGEEAMERLAGTDVVDLVLMDVEMPGMSGVDTVRCLRERGDVRPVVAVTGHSDPGRVTQLVADGYTAVLRKPLLRDELLEALGTFGVSDNVVRVEADISALIPSFLADRRADAAELGRRLEAGDLAGIARMGHRLRGSAKSYGFAGIADIGQQLETAALDGDVEVCRSEAQRLSHFLANVRVVYE